MNKYGKPIIIDDGNTVETQGVMIMINNGIFMFNAVYGANAIEVANAVSEVNVIVNSK